MLMRGTTKHTRQQIKDELDRLKARMSVGGRAEPGDALVRDHPREPPGGLPPGGRGPARARVSREGVRGAPAGEPRRDRAGAQRAQLGGLELLRAPHEPLSEGRRALRRDARGVARELQGRDARRGPQVLRRVLRRLERAARRRRGFRRGRGREARRGAVRELEEPGAVRAGAPAVPGRRPRSRRRSRRPTRPTRSSSRART